MSEHLALAIEVCVPLVHGSKFWFANFGLVCTYLSELFAKSLENGLIEECGPIQNTYNVQKL